MRHPISSLEERLRLRPHGLRERLPETIEVVMIALGLKRQWGRLRAPETALRAIRVLLANGDVEKFATQFVGVVE